MRTGALLALAFLQAGRRAGIFRLERHRQGHGRFPAARRANAVGAALMRDDDDDNDQDELLRDMQERRERNKRAETLEWCQRYNAQCGRERAAKPAQNPDRAQVSEPTRKDRSAMQNTQRDWNDWADRKIQRAIKAHDKSLLAAVADVMRDEIKKLRDENATLRERLDRIEVERGSASLHSLRAVVSGN